MLLYLIVFPFLSNMGNFDIERLIIEIQSDHQYGIHLLLNNQTGT